MRFSSILALASLSTLRSIVIAVGDLPTVDLGYEIHQAGSFNSSSGIYNFTNIRYGQAPTGNLRFRAPLPPLENRTVVQRGEIGKICPQAFPVWYERGLASLAGNPNATSGPDSSFIPAPDPREDEDCLFLDVLVPKVVFENTCLNKEDGAPVMVWIYGGGFTFGAKGGDGNPTGLMEKSQEVEESTKGVIYVTMNYRGGAFGFVSGPNLQADGDANAGLLDQRLALDWVHKYIHLFGGDNKKITIFGQSAGAGSIMHQITAYGGLKGKVPFQQAILQSPGFEPHPGSWQQDHLLQRFLAPLNVSTIEEARKLPYAQLQGSNIAMVAASNFGSFTWAPAVDGSFVPALPGRLLLQGGYDKSIKRIMTGFNSNETLYFVDPTNVTNANFIASISSTFPDAQPSIASYIENILYPDVYNSSLYSNHFNRRLLSSAEVSFSCNTYYLNRAFGANKTYAYRFSVEPGYHGEDVPYTYYNGPSPQVANETVALTLQTYLTQFAMSGQPNRKGVPEFPLYGGGVMLNIGLEGFEVLTDTQINPRCEWWQKALYF